ncbi:ribonuclease HI [Microvirga massiliensis]|uniref:ribonuclease HI n=1 Tax=Microvirga massiliensis TaxID=1033741 RepID=UPI0018CD6436|nr:ribonuclease HI [Microvirga massiliensis]
MMDGDRPIVVAYIDGACSGNPGPGGWGVVVLKSDGSFHEISGSSEGSTTNNRMELQAAIELLSRLPANAETFVYADSQYVVKGMTEWLSGWKKNGWRTSAKKEVQNIDLWLRLEALAHNRSIQWHWVRGHDGHAANERADQLAVAAVSR